MNDIASRMHDISSSNSPIGGADALTLMLHGLRLDGLAYGRRHLRGDWTFAFPQKESAYFHLVAGSPIWLSVAGGPWSEVRPGDAILVPRGDAHLLSSAPDALTPPYPEWQCRPLSEDPYDPASLPHRDDSLLFYGSMQFNMDRSHPLFRTMPPVLHAGALIPSEPAIMPLLDALASEMSSLRVGAAGMAARLADVLAVQIIRSWMEHGCTNASGWIAAARHPRIGPVLAAIHRHPDTDWSVSRLAERAGMSRSAFAAAFADTVGDTPTRYLTEVRMQQARQWIAGDGARIADVAQRLHYDSEASFSRAFKRVIGAPPSTYRTRSSDVASPPS